MLTDIIEAFSPESYEEAISAALIEASYVLERLHDARLALKELSEDPDRGFRAVLEIQQEAMALRHEVDTARDEAQDLEFSIFLKTEREIIEKLVRDYFAEHNRINLLDIPQVILEHMKPEHLINKVVVTAFNENVVPDSELVRDFNAVEGFVPIPEEPGPSDNVQAEPE